MNKIIFILIGFLISTNSHAILMSQVSDNAYITRGGYDIAWVAPVSQVFGGTWQPVDYSYQSQFGWSALTLAVYNAIGGLDAIDFTGNGYNALWNGSQHVDAVSGGTDFGVAPTNIVSIAIATPWFSNDHLHIGYW